MKRALSAHAAAITAAIGASLCCVGPFVLIALGFGAAAGAVSAFFAPMRPYLLVLAFGIVGWRLLVLYRGTTAGCCSVNDGNACAVDSRSREKAMTWFVLAVVAFFASSPYLLSELPAPSSSVNPGEPASRPALAVVKGKGDICLAIEGMSCSACAGHVEKVLSDVPGVSGVQVSYDQGEACIALNQPASVDRAALLAAVASAGYQAVEK
jgi:mercuric ion transport protein